MDRKAQSGKNRAVGKQLELDFPEPKEVVEIIGKIKEQDEDLYNLVMTLIETVADTDKENKLLKELMLSK